MHGVEETLQNGQVSGYIGGVSPPLPQHQSPHAYSPGLGGTPQIRHQPSSPEFSPVSETGRSPSPGLEAVQSDDETLKERAPSPTLFGSPSEKEYFPPPVPYGHPAFADPHSKAVELGPSGKGKRKGGWLPWIIGVVVVVVVLGVALGVGLGVGLKKSKSKNTTPSYISTTGAFNGTGIALASQSFDGDSFGSIVMYFQHHSGQIRSALLSKDGQWKSGDATATVAVDAKNATPIAAVAYARNETAHWHIFYINKNNTISEVINSNKTNVWAPGPINKLNLTPIDDQNVGLQACWYGSFYSDVSYKHSPVPGQDSSNTSDSDLTVGIHLFYGKTATSFQSAAWIYGDSVWTKQDEFVGYNGHAGVGCYSWGPGSNTYVFMINTANELNILWKDLNVSTKSTPEHPIHQWTKSNVSIPTHQNSSLGYTNSLYAQNPDLTFSGYNITWAAEKTSLPPADDTTQTFTIQSSGGAVKGLPASHLSVTALPNNSGGDSLLAFFQTNGSDVTEFVRDFQGGQWTSLGVPIPVG